MDALSDLDIKEDNVYYIAFDYVVDNQDIMMPRGLKAGLTTMHLGTVPASLSESSGRCSLTK